MKQKTDKLWSLEGGEIHYRRLKKSLRQTQKPDTPFDRAAVPYLIMLLCALVDGAVFYSLFSTISYDSPLLLMVQLAGFLFGFDVVPIFIGIQLRRLRQHLSRDWFILWLALASCVMVVAMNIVLRLTTMGQMMPAAMTTSFLGTPVEVVRDTSAAAGLTVFGIGIPLVTSLGSFFISYLTYNPLRFRKQLQEQLIAEKKDEIRRLEAVLSEYAAEADFAAHLAAEDAGRYQAMQQCHRALVLRYCDYIHRVPESTSAQRLERLDTELHCLDDAPAPKPLLYTRPAPQLQAEG